MKIWKPVIINGKEIKGYEANIYGDIRSHRLHRKNAILSKNRLSHDGYIRYRLYNEDTGKNIEISAQRIIAQTFIPNPENKPTVNHIDGNKLNNNVSNLEWATREEQMKHAYKLGLKKPVIQPHRKLTDEQVEYIRKNYKARDKTYGMFALAKKYEVSGATIKRCVNHIYYK